MEEGDFEFVDEIYGGSIPKEFIGAVEKGFKSMMSKGRLIGFPVTGFRVVINDGASHAVDSSDNAFQAAARGAFRSVYSSARPQILEPIMKVSVEGPLEFQGAFVRTIMQRRGIIIGTTEEEGFVRVDTEVPLAEMFGYSTDLRSSSQGKAEYTMEFSRYAPVPSEVHLELVKKYGTGLIAGIALDEAMRGRKALHVSLDKSVDHLREFYDEIFMDLAHSAHLEDLPTERLEMERNRIIHTYAGKSFTIHKLRHSINFLKEYAHFDPACLILQGFDFERATLADIEAFRQLAGEFNVEMWMSAVTHRGVPSNEHGIPEPVAKLASAIAVIVQMADHRDGVQLSLLKDHDNPNVAKLTLALDPSTMLLVKK